MSAILYINELSTILQYDLLIFAPIVPRKYMLFSRNRVINFNEKNIQKEVEICVTEPNTYHLIELLFNVLQEFNIKHEIVQYSPKSNAMLPYRSSNSTLYKFKKHFLLLQDIWCLNINTGWVCVLPHSYIPYRRRECSDIDYLRRLIGDSLEVINYITEHDNSNIV